MYSSTDNFNIQKDKQSFLKIIAVFSVIIGLFIIFITFMQTTKGWGPSSTISPQELANWDFKAKVGDFVGGVVGTVFSLSGFFLLYLTFQKQKETSLKAGVETRFYEMIGLHKSNVNEMEYKGSDSIHHKGRKVFDIIFDQIKDCYKDIAPFFSPMSTDVNEIYQDAYLTKVGTLINQLDKLDPIQFAHIDIAYSIVFFGVSNEDVSTLYRLLLQHYKHDFLNSVFKYIVRKPANKKHNSAEIWNELRKLKYNIGFNQNERQESQDIARYNELISIRPSGFIKFYGGHQYKLGHYFRHLFQQVKYINNLDIYSFGEKYDMVKTLRAQLSSPEQYVIFFNSVSFVGRAWELENIIEKNDSNTCFITKYNFIKNVPELTLLVDASDYLPINLQNYYPLIAFEFADIPLNRKAAERFWN